MKKVIAFFVVAALAWSAGHYNVHSHVANFGREFLESLKPSPEDTVVLKYGSWDWSLKFMEPFTEDEILATSDEARELHRIIILKTAELAQFGAEDPAGEALRTELKHAKADLAALNRDETERRMAELKADLTVAAEIEDQFSYREVTERIGSCLKAGAERRARELEIISNAD